MVEGEEAGFDDGAAGEAAGDRAAAPDAAAVVPLLGELTWRRCECAAGTAAGEVGEGDAGAAAEEEGCLTPDTAATGLSAIGDLAAAVLERGAGREGTARLGGASAAAGECVAEA